jgi:23S rRNA (guanine745-N1)-methyltransferase
LSHNAPRSADWLQTRFAGPIVPPERREAFVSKFSILACPVCQHTLQRYDKEFRCDNNHSFDISGEGYVNLLLPQRRRSKDPGYSADMIRGRERFFSHGYYQRLADEIAQLAVSYLPGQGQRGVVLDAGCGEGYYLRRIHARLNYVENDDLIRCGLDISKHAIRRAARHDPQGLYAVAPIHQMPVLPGGVDVLLSHFSPVSPEDFDRVVRPGGTVLISAPGEDHLFGLKKFLYTDPVKHEAPLQPLPWQGFELIAEQRIRYEMQVSGEGHVADLLLMTPYFWSVGPDVQAYLASLDGLTTDVDVVIHVYRRLDRDR